MISTDTFQRPHFHATGFQHVLAAAASKPQRALLVDESTRTMFSNAAAHHKATLQKLIDQVINASLVALVGCSIAAALVIGAPMSVGGSLTVMPTSEWQSLFDQRVMRASSHERRLQRLVDTVNAPIGQSWG